MLVFITRGLSKREIASDLFIGESIVKTDVKRILMKPILRARVHAVDHVYETGLL